MGNQDPDVNEFDELVVVRLLLHDSHFFDQNVCRHNGIRVYYVNRQSGTSWMVTNESCIHSLILLILHSSMITQHASSCDEANDQIRVDEALVETRRVYDKSRLSSYGPSLNFDRVAWSWCVSLSHPYVSLDASSYNPLSKYVFLFLVRDRGGHVLPSMVYTVMSFRAVVWLHIRLMRPYACSSWSWFMVSPFMMNRFVALKTLNPSAE